MFRVYSRTFARFIGTNLEHLMSKVLNVLTYHARESNVTIEGGFPGGNIFRREKVGW